MDTAGLTKELTSRISERLKASIQSKQQLVADAAATAQLTALCHAFAQARLADGRIFITGDEVTWGKVMHLHEELLARFASNRDAIPSLPIAPELLKAGRLPALLEGDILIAFVSSQRTLTSLEQGIQATSFDGDLAILRLATPHRPITLPRGTTYDCPVPGDIRSLGVLSLLLHLVCEQLEDCATPLSQDRIIASITDSIAVEEAMLAQLSEFLSLEGIASILFDAISEQSVVLLAGNGGSACDALEFYSMCLQVARAGDIGITPLPLLDSGYITCTANDWNYNYIFARGVEGWRHHSTVLIGISTSGNSSNVREAFERCKNFAIPTILLTGESGGLIGEWAAAMVRVPSKVTHRIQEAHDTVLRGMVDFIALCAREIGGD